MPNRLVLLVLVLVALFCKAEAKGGRKNKKKKDENDKKEKLPKNARNRTLLWEDEEDEHQDEYVPAEMIEEPNPCDMVDGLLDNNFENRMKCKEFEELPLIQPSCDGKKTLVPKIFHSVGGNSKQSYHQIATTLANPDFERRHYDDTAALMYIEEHCGKDAAEAYSCLAPPAFRGDLFRFCAMVAEGGVYLDEDQMPLVPLEDLYSPCSDATIGYDFDPSGDHPRKQMKILASKPGAPIFRCALDQIIKNVKARDYPSIDLELTGPAMLEHCYQKHSKSGDIAITYKDTKLAKYPYGGGLRSGERLLTHEVETLQKINDPHHYSKMFQEGRVYRDTCAMEIDFVFPTVDERVKYYMGSWWSGDESSHLRLEKLSLPHNDGVMITNRFTRSAASFCDKFDFYSCDEDCHDAFVRPNLFTVENLEKSLTQDVTVEYSNDVLKYLVPKWNGTDEPVFLFHFGDGARSGNLPVMVKARPSSRITQSNDEVTIPKGERDSSNKSMLQAIIVPLNMDRHYEDPLSKIKAADKPWHEKKNTLLWRGATRRHGDVKRTDLIEGIFDLYPEDDVDVGLTGITLRDREARAERFVKPSMSYDEMLSYKYLLSIEGNDVATNLKWMLYSDSVVFMPRPTAVSWAMEDKLVPFYHYIPLEDDLLDIQEKIQWARENDYECRRIAERATKYMEDLWMSEKAQEDNDTIISKIVDQYRMNYGKVLRDCVPSTKRLIRGPNSKKSS